MKQKNFFTLARAHLGGLGWGRSLALGLALFLLLGGCGPSPSPSPLVPTATLPSVPTPAPTTPVTPSPIPTPVPTTPPTAAPSPTVPAVGTMMTVTVYYGNVELNPEADCSRVFPVERRAPFDPAVAQVALRALFAGPTAAEAAAGYSSLFSEETAGILIGLRVEGDTVYINLRDVRSLIPNASSSCGSAQFFAEVETTLGELIPFERVIYAIEGDPEPFYEWVQLGCSELNDNCDPAPFAAILQPSDAPAYRYVELSEANLALEVPAAWQSRPQELDQAWVADGLDRFRLGVRWTELQPPMEIEAALLPQPAQVLASEPVELSWGSGRRVTLELYGPAAEGGDEQAPVASVETHILITAEIGGTRYGYDLYAAAPTAEGLEQLAPLLQHMVDTSGWLRGYD